jgi:hypothetical protein
VKVTFLELHFVKYVLTFQSNLLPPSRMDEEVVSTKDQAGIGTVNKPINRECECRETKHCGAL